MYFLCIFFWLQMNNYTIDSIISSNHSKPHLLLLTVIVVKCVNPVKNTMTAAKVKVNNQFLINATFKEQVWELGEKTTFSKCI